MPENRVFKNLQKTSAVLITGGNGLIGRHLTSTLLAAGYNVSHLSRSTNPPENIRTYMWDPGKGILDPKAFEGIDFLIHLAGANIGEKRWSKKRKQEIIKSRVDSAYFLHKVITDNGIKLKGVISASATGIYGSETSTKIFDENDPPASDYLGSVCSEWEDAADLFRSSEIRTVKIRTAVVLEKDDSALSKLMSPGRFGFLVQTGDGGQYMPWIHIVDLCNIYLKALEDSGMNGVYNAVSPQHITHGDFMRILARVMKVPLLPVPIPGFLLKVGLGEMSDVILKGSRVSSEKILNSGYRFIFGNLEYALENIIRG